MNGSFKPYFFGYIGSSNNYYDKDLKWIASYNTSDVVTSHNRSNLTMISLSFGLPLTTDGSIRGFCYVERLVRKSQREINEESYYYGNRVNMFKWVRQTTDIFNITLKSLEIVNGGLRTVNFNSILKTEGAILMSNTVQKLEIFSDSLSKLTSFSHIKIYSSIYYIAKISTANSLSNIRFKVNCSTTIGSWGNNVRINEDGLYLLSLTVFTNHRNNIFLAFNNSRKESFFLKASGKKLSANVNSMFYLFKGEQRDIYSMYMREKISLNENSQISIVKIKECEESPVLYVTSSLAKSNIRRAENIKFNEKRISIGNEWCNEYYKYSIKKKGYYFIFLSIDVHSDENVDVSVKKNDDVIFEILRFSEKIFGGYTLTNSGIFSLTPGDVITVISNPNSNYGIENNLTSLMILYL